MSREWVGDSFGVKSVGVSVSRGNKGFSFSYLDS